MPDLSIIIVSWNVADMLERCLNSIEAALRLPGAPSAEVIVVDSASTDDTSQRIRARFPDVRLIPLPDNEGYVKGNNRGMDVATGRHLFLLNPDTEVIGDALSQMTTFLDHHPDVGIVGPHTLNADGTHQSTRRRFPTLLTGLFESTWLQPFAPRSVLQHYYVHDIADDANSADVDWVQGSALMARRDVYAQIGQLDEGYVMYSEEMDWCRRAKQADWRVVYLGGAKIIHYGGLSTSQAPARSQIYFHQSKLRYFHKYHGAFSAQILRLFLLANYASQIVLESAKHLLGHKRALRRERIHIYWQVLRSGLKVT